MNRFKKNILYCILIIFCTLQSHFVLFAQEQGNVLEQISGLTIAPSDIRLEIAADGGWNLYVRQKPDMQSILLTETTKDPLGLEDSYTYRANEWNAINGDEQRILNGEFLDSEYSRYSIVDSTPQADTEFGRAFQLYIPKTLIYGYPWSRNGVVQVAMGTFINIRSFEEPFADYDGSFADNPFMFDFSPPPEPIIEPAPPPPPLPIIEPELPPEPAALPPEPVVVALTDSYNSRAAEAFSEIASGMMIYSRGPETIVDDVMKSFRELPTDKPIDVVFAVDATGSMWDDIKRLQTELIPELTAELEKREGVRLGLLFYRDFSDNFKFEGLPVLLHPFTDDHDEFFEKLKAMSIREKSNIGGDIPEAVYEALYASLEYYQWNPNAERKIILIGDAEPHPKPRTIYGKSKEEVETLASRKNITIDCIITPDGLSGTR